MYQALKTYLSYQGMTYIKPEKAGALEQNMLALKAAGQEARAAFTSLAKTLEPKIAPFTMDRVSNWASQAQIARPHFWTYFKQPSDNLDDVGIAIRLYGTAADFGISCEVSFIERKKSETTLAKQAKVLAVPIAEPLYYFVQVDGVSHREVANEESRKRLQAELAAGQARKVLVKYDIPVTENLNLEELTDQLAAGFDKVMPYYQATKCK